MVCAYVSIVFALILGVLWACLSSKLKNKEHNPSQKIPNGNMGWPFIGETLAFLKPHKSNSIGDFLQEHFSRYGRVFKSHLFGCKAIVSCDHELNNFILQNEEKLFQASYPSAMHGILGKFSLLVVSGELHRKMRNIAVNFIASSKSSPEFIQSVERLSISLVESWSGCKEIHFYEEIKKFTLNVMIKSLLSIEPEAPLAFKIFKDFQTYMKGFISLPLNIPGSAYAKAVKARARLASTVKEIMKEREEGEVLMEKKGDFLEVIMTKKGLSDQEKVTSVLDLLLGGYETTSTLIALIVYFLAHSPSSFHHLKEEHEAIRRSKKEREALNLEDYHKMSFTNNVIYEAMRCGNVVKFVHRESIQEVKYKGYVIPRGWKVLPVLMAVHLDPSLHENPLEFNPWRWATDKTIFKKVMPFGGGARLCPGADLAKVEVSCFLHHLVRNYRWKVKEDDFPLAQPYVEFSKGLLIEIERV